MKVLIILAHPEPRSMNGALFTKAIEIFEAAGHEVRFSDLYSMRFDPVSDRRNFTVVKNADYYKQQLEELHATEHAGFAADIDGEQEKLEWCDLMIWQFPLWWFTVPGILKGWVDRVFAMGRVYGQGRVYKAGVFGGKKALLSLTTGGASETYLDEGMHGDLLGVLRPIHRGMLRFTGWSVLAPHVIYGPVRMSEEERASELERWARRLEGIFEEEEIEVGTY